jgi:hypothetical protein
MTDLNINFAVLILSYNINVSYEYYINFIAAKGLKMDMKYFINVSDMAGDHLDIEKDHSYLDKTFFFPMALQPFLGPWPHISVSKSILHRR